MANTKIALQEIADKACIFDHAHFDDDTPPTAESILTNHERLPSDRKLITRLRPRYIAALGYFEGYSDAVDIVPMPKIKDREIATKAVDYAFCVVQSGHQTDTRPVDLLYTMDFLKGASAAQPVAPSIALSCAFAAGFKAALTSPVQVIAKSPSAPSPIAPVPPDMSHDDCIRCGGSGWIDGFVGSACDVPVRQNSEIGKKLYATRTAEWMAAQTALDTERQAHRRTVIELGIVKERDTLLVRRAVFNELRQLQNRIALKPIPIVSRDEMTQFVEETITRFANLVNSQSIGKAERAWSEMDGAVKSLMDLDPKNMRIVIESSPAAASVPNKLSTEVDDDLAQAAAEYMNSFLQLAPNSDDLQNAKSACSNSATVLKVWLEDHWAFGVNGFINGARWQSARAESRAGEDPPNVHELRSENERLHRLVESTANQGAEWRDQSERMDARVAELLATNELLQSIATKDAALNVMLRNYALPTEPKAFAREYESRTTLRRRDYPLAPTPITFRDDTERDFWAAMVLVLARKADTTAISVASAADEMVEERRARVPIAQSEQIELNGLSDDVSIEKLKEANKSLRESLSVEIDNRNALEDKIAALTNRPAEVTDELFMEAIEYANQHVLINKSTTDLASAREAFGNKSKSTWHQLVRAYAEGALRRSQVRPLASPKEPMERTNLAEPSDSLLLQAAAYANEKSNLIASDNDLSHAQSAVNGNFVLTTQWSNAIRSYVAGALGK